MTHYLGHEILWELKNKMDSFFTEKHADVWAYTWAYFA